MATNDITMLLGELDVLDTKEDSILDDLLRRGAAMEDARRRSMMVTVGDLRSLRDGLASLEAAIDEVQARTAQAEAAAKEPDAQPRNGTTAPEAAPAPEPAKPAALPAPASSPALPTFEELAARMRAHDAESDRMRALLRERLRELGAIVSDPAGTAATPDPAAPPVVADPGSVAAPNGTAGVTPAVPVGVPHVSPAEPGRVPTNPAGPAPTKQPRTLRRRLDKPMSGADVIAFQRDLNRRFEAWDIDMPIPVNGVYDKQTWLAARRALRGLGIDPADCAGGITPHLRVLIRKPGRRTDEQKLRARELRPWLGRLRRNQAATKAKRRRAKPATNARAKPMNGSTPPAGGSLAAAIRRHGGRYEDIIIREARRHGLPVALVCAVVECESDFHNLFGHDPTIFVGAGTVTKDKYVAYKAQRGRTRMQGVGPMQLTWWETQDRADRLGGCWKQSVNIRVGCEVLAANIDKHGKRQGIRRYNGTGPAAEAYATKILKHEAVWRRHLAGAKPAVPAKGNGARHPPGGATKRLPRTFKVPMRGDDVQALQRAINARFESWKIRSRISEDGEYGKTTSQAAKQVLLGLGIEPAAYAHGITPALRSKIRDPRKRSPAEVARAAKRKDYRAKLRKRMASKGALRLRAYAEARRLENLNVREVGGNNRGPIVSQIIRGAGGAVGDPWCGWFISHCYRAADSKAISSAWGRVFSYTSITGLKKTSNPLKGDLVRYLDGQGHIGMFVCWCDARGKEVDKSRATHVKTIEGNTSSSGAVVSDSARGGDGVYEKVRARGFNGDFIHVSR